MRLSPLFLVASLLPAPGLSQTCVEAQVGSERAYDCVNDALARLAQSAHGPLATNTLTAASPAPATGTFNRSATAERMGNAFGHSVIAQRPPPPVYVNPVGPR